MKKLRPWARLFLCVFIIIAFFLPSYKDLSAVDFIYLAFSDVGEMYGLTPTDAFVATGPLIFIPITVIIISVRSLLKLPTRKIYTMLPLLLLLFFMAMIIDSEVKEGRKLSGSELLSQTHAGFYILLLSMLFLPFTKNPRRKKSRKAESKEPQVAF